MSVPNPFIESYLAIIAALVVHQPLQDLADIVSIITVVGDEERHVNSNHPGDVPSLRLVPANGVWNVPSSSSGSDAIQIYVLEAVSGEIDATLYMQIKFQVGRALATAIDKDTFITDYITELRLTETVDNNNNAELQKGIQGWTGTLQIEAELGIDNSCMIEGG